MTLLFERGVEIVAFLCNKSERKLGFVTQGITRPTKNSVNPFLTYQRKNEREREKVSAQIRVELKCGQLTIVHLPCES